MDNIIRFKKPFQMRFGIVIFLGLFIYLAIITVSFAFQKRTSIYEIQIGDLSTSYSYTALAIRKEKVVEAKNSGYISYFAEENTKVGAKSLVYSLDQTGDIYKSIKSQANENIDEEFFSTERKRELQDAMNDYAYNYSDNSFYLAYPFKDALNLKIVENIARGEGGAKLFKGMSAYFASKSGVILYYKDSMEDLTLDSFTEKDIYGTSYQSQNLKQVEFVNKGDPVYKVITDENWNLVAPVDDELREELTDQEYVNVTIKSDNYNADLPFKIINRNGKYYIVLSLSNGCIRYSSLRYLEIELNINQTKGYKIPNSSIFETEFIRVPREYLMQSGSKDGFLKVETDKKGNESIVFHSATIFDSDDDYFYIHSESINKGNQLQKPQSDERLLLNDTKPYSCVFCINKGYAVLKMVHIIDSNEDYSIAEIGTAHGVNNFDHIVLDGKQIKEGELVH